MGPENARPVSHTTLLSHGIRALGDLAPFHAVEHAPGPMILLSIDGGPNELVIDTVAARPDHAVFAFVDTAPSSTMQSGAWPALESGLVLAPSGIAHHVRCEAVWRITAAYVPRAALVAAGAALPVTASSYTGRRQLDRAMQAFIEQILSAEEQATAVERYAIARLILEMSDAILFDRVGEDSRQRSSQAALRDRALALIAQQCGDPSLNPASIARELQTSLRQLQLVFAEAEKTVAGEIRHQRARLAQSLLIDSRFDALSIEQISQRAGFHSPMSLRRAIEEHHGTTPSALRAHRSDGREPTGP